MPELPEVETIVRELRRKITGKTVRGVLVLDKRIPRPEFGPRAKIVGVGRHGKYIVLHTDRRGYFLIHLRMTGELRFEKRARRKISGEKRERAALFFGDGSALRFFDVRRFGTLEWRRDPLPELGANPLSRAFDAAAMAGILRGGRRPIKSLLLDQKRVSGLGNIYADESLWAAGLHPQRKGGDLSAREIARLVRSIKKILREALRKKGSTMRDYRRTGGESGYYQRSRKAYDREGLPCLRCGTKIKRIKASGRSGYFCPQCQRRRA